jgi:hypothetical protein
MSGIEPSRIADCQLPIARGLALPFPERVDTISRLADSRRAEINERLRPTSLNEICG